MPTRTDTTVNDRFRLRAPSRFGQARLAVFGLLVLALLALNLMMTPRPLLVKPFVGWFQVAGIHHVHEMAVFGLLWLLVLGPLALQLYRPSGRVNAMLAPLAYVLPVAAMAFLADSFLFGGFFVMSGLVLAALVLHPAGRSLTRFERAEPVGRRIAGLFVLGALPLAAYGAIELGRQLGPVDEHVVFVHYGGMAIAAFYVAGMGTLALLRRRDWRFAAWSAGAVAGFLGLVSVAFPAGPSSLGLFGGLLVTAWAVVFVAGVEQIRRDDPADAVEGRDPTAQEAA